MGHALDSRPDYQQKVIDTVREEMKNERPIFTWFKSSGGEMYTLAPGFLLLLTGSSTMGKSKLFLRLAGATSHVEIPLGSDEDSELRQLILKTEPETMDGDEWVCTLFANTVGVLGKVKRQGDEAW